MKKLSNLILILLMSFIFSGCATALLLTGTVVGGIYVADDVNENYNGDLGEYIEDKSEKAYDAVTGD